MYGKRSVRWLCGERRRWMQVLTKPFIMAALATKVRDMIDRE
jgi:hypothetical protein